MGDERSANPINPVNHPVGAGLAYKQEASQKRCFQHVAAKTCTDKQFSDWSTFDSGAKISRNAIGGKNRPALRLELLSAHPDPWTAPHRAR